MRIFQLHIFLCDDIYLGFSYSLGLMLINDTCRHCLKLYSIDLMMSRTFLSGGRNCFTAFRCEIMFARSLIVSSFRHPPPCLEFKLKLLLSSLLLKVLLGGRAAEEVIFGRDTSKASVNYLADASWLARKIITMYAFHSLLN